MGPVDALVIRPGMRVRASGAVCSDGNGLWLQPSIPRGGVWGEFPDNREWPVRHDAAAIGIDGFDIGGLEEATIRGRAVTNWVYARLAGVWDGARIAVDWQGPPDDSPEPQQFLRWTTPPCPAPNGGWPTVQCDGSSDTSRFHWPPDWDAPEIVHRTLFRPSEVQVVMVVASTDPELTRSRLTPELALRVCVVASPWTRRDVARFRAGLRDGDWEMRAHGERSDASGHLIVFVAVGYATPALAEYLSGWPTEAIDVSAWLRPE